MNISLNMNREETIWQELECGSYRADLSLWSELASECQSPVLDVGAGSGRVALHLAAEAHRVIALERSRELLDALRERAGELQIQTVCADARTFELPQAQNLELIIVPMQTIQLLGGSPGRRAFLAQARAHLRPGGLLACAIVCELEPFDCDEDDQGPAAEQMQLGDILYRSRATQVKLTDRAVVLGRERAILPLADGACKPRYEQNIIELDLLSVADLCSEAQAEGFRAEPSRAIGATEEHTSSIVVMLRA